MIDSEIDMDLYSYFMREIHYYDSYIPQMPKISISVSFVNQWRKTHTPTVNQLVDFETINKINEKRQMKLEKSIRIRNN